VPFSFSDNKITHNSTMGGYIVLLTKLVAP
jgi:hypothetical protein